MTLSEFKAWFEGFSEGIDTAPTEKQFAKITAKVAEIDGTAITYPVFVDRYWRFSDWGPYWQNPIYGGATAGWTLNNGANVGYSANAAYMAKGDAVTTAFDSHAAMHAIGRAEAVN